MSDNSESQQPKTTSLASAATTSKSVIVKKLKALKTLYGKLSFRLLIDHEHALRIASVQLERKGEEIYTPQQMVDHAMERYLDYLQVKKDVDLMGIVPKKASVR
jgi:hypothetical protein